jgi:glycosyltransferase involved in cell wall biosynthesis
MIADAIGSVKAQTRAPVEILVIDDGSTDGSADIAEKSGARVIRLPCNRGNSAARNVGIRASSGDAIAWLDSDDYWEPHHLATVASLLDAYPQAAVASAAVRFLGEECRVWYGNVPDGPPSDVLRPAFYNTAVPMTTSVVRREALLAAGGFEESERCAVDFDLWLRMAMRFQFVATREITANYRLHPGQISANPERQWEATYRFRRSAIDTIMNTGQSALADELSALFRTRWQTDVWAAWDSEDRAWLRRLTGLSALVPGITRSQRRKWLLRSYISPRALHLIRSCREFPTWLGWQRAVQ